MQRTDDMAQQRAPYAIGAFVLVHGYGIQPTPVAVITSQRGGNNLDRLGGDENETVNLELCGYDPCGVVVRRIVRKNLFPKSHQLRVVGLAVKTNVHSCAEALRYVSAG